MTAPSGRDLLATIIRLLADQENVNITYEFEEVCYEETKHEAAGP